MTCQCHENTKCHGESKTIMHSNKERFMLNTKYGSFRRKPSSQELVGQFISQLSVNGRSVSRTAVSLCNVVIKASSLRNHYYGVKI